MLLFDVCIYCQMITIKSLVNIVTIHSYTFCVCVIRIFKISSLSNFQVHHTVLLVMALFLGRVSPSGKDSNSQPSLAFFNLASPVEY